MRFVCLFGRAPFNHEPMDFPFLRMVWTPRDGLSILGIFDHTARVRPELLQLALELLGRFDARLFQHMLGMESDIPAVLVEAVGSA